MAIDILNLLTKTMQRNLFVVVMKDRYSKLTRAIPTVKVTAPLAPTILLENWVIPY